MVSLTGWIGSAAGVGIGATYSSERALGVTVDGWSGSWFIGECGSVWLIVVSLGRFNDAIACCKFSLPCNQRWHCSLSSKQRSAVASRCLPIAAPSIDVSFIAAVAVACCCCCVLNSNAAMPETTAVATLVPDAG